MLLHKQHLFKLCSLICKRNFSSAEKPRLSYLSSTSDTPLLGWTIGDVLDRSSATFGNQEAIVISHQNIRRTFKELKTDADDFASGLLSIGLEKGQRVGMWNLNNYEWIVSQFACAKAGLILVHINPANKPMELEHCLKNAGVSALIFPGVYKSQNFHEVLKGLIPGLEQKSPGKQQCERFPKLKHLINVASKQLKGSHQFKELLEAGRRADKKQLQEVQQKVQFDDPSSIIYTSGTTGLPKGALLTHHNIVNNANLIGRRLGFNKKNQRGCCTLPLFHIFGATGSVTCVLSGACAIYPSLTFDVKSAVEIIQKEKATHLQGTPTIFVDILLLKRDQRRLSLRSLHTAVTGGAHCPPELIEKFIKYMRVKNFLIGYGTTETSPCVALVSGKDSIEKKKNTVGRILPHTEVKIVKNNEVVPVGTTGELWTRGYFVMLGYWKDRAKTKEVFTPDRWYKTGDLATIDKEGYLTIVGRLRDMVIRGGENIYPAEIEEFLRQHEKIVEAQVVGVPDARMGEEVCACLRLKKGQVMTEDEVKKYCKDNIAMYKIPRYILFMEDFPRTNIGKVRKNQLRTQCMKKLKLSDTGGR